MFESKHYVPILKWKRAEHKALVELDNDAKKHITPLIQLIMPRPVIRNREETKRKKIESKMSPEKQQWLQKERAREESMKTPEDREKEAVLKREKDRKEVISRCKDEMMPSIAKKVLKYWGKDPIFVDLNLILTQDLKLEGFSRILNDARELNLNLIPVVYLSDNLDLKEMVCSLTLKYNSGLCLRLVLADLIYTDKLNQDLENFLKIYGLGKEQVDLLVDIQDMDGNVFNYSTYFDLSQKIKDLKKWRTLIFTAGSFPKDLSECTFDEPTIISRDEWKQWNIKMEDKKIERMPSFSDYVTQHPIFDPSSQFYHPTTSIRYTLNENWLVLKGKRQKYEFYLINSKLLAGSDKWFMGEDYSYGDKYIKGRSDFYEDFIKDKITKGRAGSPETWIGACVNHHLVHTSNQISNLP